MYGAIARKIEFGIFGRAAPPSGLTLGSEGSPGGHPLTRLVPGGCASCKSPLDFELFASYATNDGQKAAANELKVSSRHEPHLP